MKTTNLTTILTGLFVLVFLGFSGTLLAQEAQEQESSAKSKTARVDVSKLSVNGMYCAGCVDQVHKAASAVKGVKKVEVSLEANQATIEYDGNEAVLQEVVQVIENAGYDAKEVEPEPKKES